MNAYESFYLPEAKSHLGACTDYLINRCGIAADRAVGYSQSELARRSGVNIRNIQLYEQRVQDINRASAASLAALAQCLSCSIEDLME